MKSCKSYKNVMKALLFACLNISFIHAHNTSFDLMSILHGFSYQKASTIPQAANSKVKNIIFDLDGVLSTTNKMQAFYEVGLGATLNFIYDQQTLPSEKILFDSLAGVPAISTAISYNKGVRMPQIMIDWQTGAQSIQALKDAVIDYLATANFAESQKQWVLHTWFMMTDPVKFIKTRQTISANVQLLHELKNKGYKLYILSNWDKDSFPLFEAHFPEIFLHNNQPTFDDIMISGQVDLVKPDSAIFQESLEQFNLNTDQTVFIDDEPANVQAAQAVGIHTILSNPADPQLLRTNLITQLIGLRP